MRLHLHPPRHALVTSMFWLIALLPWLTLASLLAIRLQLGSNLFTGFWPLAFLASILLRESLLETPEQKTGRDRRVRAPMSKWWMLGIPTLLLVGAVLPVYLATFLPPRDSIWTRAIAGLLMLSILVWDVARQYRRGLA